MLIELMDELNQALELVEKLEKHLPIYVTLPQNIRQHIEEKANVRLTEDARLEVEEIFYGGESTGITCILKIPERSDTTASVPIIHLQIVEDCPFADEIRAYQQRRTNRLEFEKKFWEREQKMEKKKKKKKAKSKPGKGFGKRER